jgi:hypothetical protein
MVVTTKTRAQLGTRALQKLGIYGAGQSPEDEDAEHADSVIDAVLADLAAREVVLITDEDAIPVEYFEWVADIVADALAQDYYKGRNPDVVMFAERMLHKITNAQQTYEVLRVEYY